MRLPEAAWMWQFGAEASCLVSRPWGPPVCVFQARLTLIPPGHGLSREVAFSSSSPFGSCRFSWLQTLLAASSASLQVHCPAFPTPWTGLVIGSVWKRFYSSFGEPERGWIRGSMFTPERIFYQGGWHRNQERKEDK